MSENEKNQVKFQNEIFGKDAIFQQATMFSQSHQYQKAIEYYNSYILRPENKKKDTQLAIAYNNIGSVFCSQGEYEKSFRIIQESFRNY